MSDENQPCQHQNVRDDYQEGNIFTTLTVICVDCGAIVGSQTWRNGVL